MIELGDFLTHSVNLQRNSIVSLWFWFFVQSATINTHTHTHAPITSQVKKNTIKIEKKHIDVSIPLISFSHKQTGYIKLCWSFLFWKPIEFNLVTRLIVDSNYWLGWFFSRLFLLLFVTFFFHSVSIIFFFDQQWKNGEQNNFLEKSFCPQIQTTTLDVLMMCVSMLRCIFECVCWL